MEPLPDDATLVAGLRSRDEAIFELVVTAWSPTMTRIARSHVSTADSAAEVVQDAWLAVLTGIDRFEGRSALRTWVFRIVTNKASSRGVREGRTLPWSSLDPADHSPTVDPHRFRDADDAYPGHWRSFPQQWPSPEAEAIRSDVSDVVATAVEDLPMRQQVVIIMRDVLGCSSEEVCDVLGVTTANQRVILHRARAAVRQRLENLFGAAARWEATS